MTGSRRDIVKETMTQSLRAMNQAMNEVGWDQPPALFAVHRAIDMSQPEVTALGLLFARVETGPILTSQHPSDGLAMIARAVRSGLRPPDLPDNLFAFAFASESWMAGPDAREAAENRELHTRADRIECRVLSAVDLAGVHYLHIIPRDESQSPRIESASRPSERGEGSHVDGYIHQSLTVLVDVLATP